MADVKTYHVDEPWLDVECTLGEGIAYNFASKTLRFLDIVGQKLFLVDMAVGKSSLKTFDLETAIGSTVEVQGRPNELFCGALEGVGFLDINTGRFHYTDKFPPETITHDLPLRSNDGSADPRGRFLVGTMVDPTKSSGYPVGGTLYRIDHDLNIHALLADQRVPNGSSWSADGKTFYYTDSLTYGIDAFDYDLDTGAISNRRVFWKADPAGSAPDGHCRDEEGFFWVALALGSQVVRLSPEGKVVARVHLPTRLITDTVVADDGYLYITSGTESDPSAHPESAKKQGRVYRCHVGVKGVPEYQFRPAK